MSHPRIISIEGNIGTGKSTLISALKDAYKNTPDVVFLQEPVNEWIQYKNEDGSNLLELFYNDMQRWSFTFQLTAYITRIQSIQALIDYDKPPRMIIMERSVYTDRNIFATNLYRTDKISKLEWELYTKWFSWLEQTFPLCVPTDYIYLRAPSDVSFHRMHVRSRVEENKIPFSYIDTLHRLHDDWLLSSNNTHKVRVVDYSYSFNDARYISSIDAIRTYIEQ